MCKFGLDSANAPPSPVPELQAEARERWGVHSWRATNYAASMAAVLPAPPLSGVPTSLVFDRNHDEVHEILTYVEKGSRHTIATFMSAVELFIALVAFYQTTEGTTLWFDIDARELEVSGAQGTSPPPDDPIHRLQGKRAAGAMATSEILVTSPSPSNSVTCWLVGEGITRSDPGPRPRTPSPGPEDDPPQALTPEPEQEQLPMALLDRLAEDDKIIYYCVALLCCCVMVYSLFPASAVPPVRFQLGDFLT
ncbi:hypothetical protein BJY52DRAFT_1228592 [Lactarius psammicola]|nr:hypothetical protein BJY52DRAFT_1228592 [Lactarius psammicola]